MTGDSLFVGDVARVDLVDIPGTGTDIMYSSIQKLLALPDDVEIYPGHFGGSACGGRAMSGKASSTIGFERRFNWALQAPDEQTFNEWMKQDVREAVDGILMHRNTNRGELPLPAGYFGSHATSMPLNDMRDAQAQGVLVLDVRPTAVFNLGHMAGVINIPFQREVMLDRARALLGSQESLIVYADTLATAETAAAELRGAGFQVVGVSMAKLGDVVTLPTVTIDDLHQTVLNGGLVVDVREPHEHAKGTIEGAILLPLLSLPHEAKNLPDVPLNLVCESGTRATIAATYLKSLGKQVATVVVPGGMSDYNAKYAEALKA
jgi:hydroxyacylglutathione hydrolase